MIIKKIMFKMIMIKMLIKINSDDDDDDDNDRITAAFPLGRFHFQR